MAFQYMDIAYLSLAALLGLLAYASHEMKWKWIELVSSLFFVILLLMLTRDAFEKHALAAGFMVAVLASFVLYRIFLFQYEQVSFKVKDWYNLRQKEKWNLVYDRLMPDRKAVLLVAAKTWVNSDMSRFRQFGTISDEPSEYEMKAVITTYMRAVGLKS